MDEPAPRPPRTFERPGPMGIDIPMGRSPAEVRRRMEAMEKLLERRLQLAELRVEGELGGICRDEVVQQEDQRGCERRRRWLCACVMLRRARC